MYVQINKPSFMKRIFAWLLDGILMVMFAIFIGSFLVGAVNYEEYNKSLDAALEKYETQYGVDFAITQEQYDAMTEAERENFDAANAALSADEEATKAYNMVVSQTLLIITGSIILSMLLLEVIVPLLLQNGQTIGKKIFSLGVMGSSGVRMSVLQLLVRVFLGKFTVETMLPIYILALSLFGPLSSIGILILMALLMAQVIIPYTSQNNSQIHDFLARTVVVDLSSQYIYQTRQELEAAQEKDAAL